MSFEALAGKSNQQPAWKHDGAPVEMLAGTLTGRNRRPASFLTTCGTDEARLVPPLVLMAGSYRESEN